MYDSILGPVCGLVICLSKVVGVGNFSDDSGMILGTGMWTRDVAVRRVLAVPSVVEADRWRRRGALEDEIDYICFAVRKNEYSLFVNKYNLFNNLLNDNYISMCRQTSLKMYVIQDFGCFRTSGPVESLTYNTVGSWTLGLFSLLNGGKISAFFLFCFVVHIVLNDPIIPLTYAFWKYLSWLIKPGEAPKCRNKWMCKWDVAT